MSPSPARFALGLAALAACSVPPLSLDGKRCPCTTGYVCDEVTDRCLATNDAGIVIDTPGATQCTASLVNEVTLYEYQADLMWAERGGTWTSTATEIRQTDKMASAFAYRTAANLNVDTVRVLASMSETAEGNGGMPGIGITMRTTLDGSTRYRCMWSSGMRQLAILRDDTPLGTPVTVAPGTVVPARITMEASAVGSSLSCCIRELEVRVADVTDTTLATGFSGLEAERKAAVYDRFVMFGSQ